MGTAEPLYRDRWGKCLYCGRGEHEPHTQDCYHTDSRPQYEPYGCVGCQKKMGTHIFYVRSEGLFSDMAYAATEEEAKQRAEEISKASGAATHVYQFPVGETFKIQGDESRYGSWTMEDGWCLAKPPGQSPSP